MTTRANQLIDHVKTSKLQYFRPTVHLTASCWINDPCAPGYDVNTKTYHLFYQCNPSDCAWADMHWGHLTSKDLLKWHRTSTNPTLKPDQDYDQAGVFTGCFIPQKDDGGNRELAVVYSSIRMLPFHWSTPPYPRNVAGLALASSTDGGKTWEKSTSNPILEGEPSRLEVSGFRDPYVAEWPEVDRLRGKAEAGLYGIISGGLHDVGPTTFLYEIQPNDPKKWTYLNPLVDLPERFQPSKRWCGNFGMNWECTNFMTLEDESGKKSRHFLIVCPEGDVERNHIKNHTLPEDLPPRTIHQQLWMSSDLVKTVQGIQLQYQHGGYLDHGSYYAANSFIDSPTGRRIVYGWIPEEDCTVDYAREKGWNGAIAIPRELFLISIPNVVKALHSPLTDIESVECVHTPDSAATLYTLGVKPIVELEQWRGSCLVTQRTSRLSIPQSQCAQKQLFTASTPVWELEATIDIKPECKSVGFHLRHDSILSRRCTITFSVLDETITVDRSCSTGSADVNTCPEMGPFTLFTTQTPAGVQRLEKLRLRIFSDGDILEVFANDRFAMATMVYSDRYGEDAGGVSAFAIGRDESAVFEDVTLWDGLNGMKPIVVDEIE